MAQRFYNLRILLSVAIAGLVLLAVAGTTLVHGLIFDSYARAEAERLLRTTAQSARAEVKRYLQPAEIITKHLLAARTAQIIDSEPGHRQALFSSFLSSVEVVPSFSSHVYSAYLGMADGSFVSLVRSSPDLRAAAGIESASMSPFLTLEKDVSRADGLDHWSYRKDDRWHRVARPRVNYDPRTRPWFRSALESAYPVWTDVYRFTVEDGYGITLASRVTGQDGRVAGVVGVDLRLEDLAGFIQNLEVGQSGFSFLAGSDGRLIAHAGMGSRFSSGMAPDADRLTIQHLHRTDKADLQLFSRLASTPEKFAEFQASGASFVGMRLPLGNQFGLDVDLYVAAPLSDFNSSAYEALEYTLWMTLALTLVVLVLGTVIARAIARPICSAATAMKKVAELDLENPLSTGTTHLSEIEMLNRSLGVMHRALTGFSKYLPRELVRDLMQLGLPIELGGSRREITVLMTDIVGFSRTMEAADNDQLIEDLADYFDVISTTIHEYGGTVDKFIGDAVMAFWGAPRSDEAHAQHACNAVIAIAARLDDFNESRLAVGKPAFETRFALHSGDAFVGNVGARDRFGYTALGDVVNTASRLEKLGKAFGVQAIVSRDVARRTKPQHKFRCLGDVRPEGKSNRIGAMELVLCSSSRRPSKSPAKPAYAPALGRL